METNEQKIWPFWDGDFTFHMVEYDHDPKLNRIFRVRIDNASPEERAEQNVGNHNRSAPGWSRTRRATDNEIAHWIDCFKDYLPLRDAVATEGLRRLRINGPTGSNDLPVAVVLALLRLTFGVMCVRDFKPTRTKFVEIVDHDDKFQLTDEGRWLTSLMK